MSALAKIWSLSIASTGEAPQAPNYDIWVVSNLLLNRVVTNAFANHLNTIPRSETRLRDEGILPFYSYLRKMVAILEPGARERGVALPDILGSPADWKEEVATDYKALAEQVRPYLAGPAVVTLDWRLALREDAKHHWTSEVAAFWVSLDIYTQALLAIDGVRGGSEWEPIVALLTSDEFKEISAVMSEELLRIRAQSGSGWDEEEAKRLANEQIGNARGVVKIGA